MVRRRFVLSKRRTMRRRLVGATLTLVVLSCSPDYEVPVQNGFLIARYQAGRFALIAPDRHTVVVDNIAKYRTDGGVVSGQTTSQDGQPEFFVVDTQTRSVTMHLSAREWAAQLNRLGFRDHQLKVPKRPGFFTP